jgi:hypothetical protein
VLEEGQHARAQPDHPVEGTGAQARQVDPAGLFKAREQLFLLRVERQAAGTLLAPGAPEHLRADVVEARHFRQVPAQGRRAAQFSERLVDALERTAPCQRVNLPYAARHHGSLRTGRPALLAGMFDS